MKARDFADLLVILTLFYHFYHWTAYFIMLALAAFIMATMFYTAKVLFQTSWELADEMTKKKSSIAQSPNNTTNTAKPNESIRVSSENSTGTWCHSSSR